jgi:hypothetical protein
MEETRVDLLHLLEDLRDAYPGALEATIITEIVANRVDSDARHIQFMPEASQTSLSVVDEGAGMHRKDLIRYHDLAASAKQAGQGIGVAGRHAGTGEATPPHPAYRRAVASRSEGYHSARCVALAVARLAVEQKESHTFMTR